MEDVKVELKKKFLEMLKEDEEFRYTVAGYIGLTEILKRLEEHDKKFISILEKIENIEKRIENIEKRLEEHVVRFDRLEKRLDAIGARWGLMSEEAFRDGIRGVLEKELGFKVERWAKFDDRGYVYGSPGEVEVDVVISDDRVILVEIKAHVGMSDVFVFKRKVEFYKMVEGREPVRAVIVSPYVDDKAVELAVRFGLEVYKGSRI